MEENTRNIFTSALPINTDILKVVPEKSVERFAVPAANSENVFKSNIPINTTSRENNLFELLELREDPPQLVTENDKESDSNVHFVPKSGKTFTSKYITRQKVRTLKDVRKEYENFYLSFLDDDLKTQQRSLMRKVRDGSVRDTKTIVAARQLLEGDIPISRSSWRMLMNINPKKLPCPVQFVLYDGKKVRVSGSLGGQKIYLVNRDLKMHRKELSIRNDGIKVYKRKKSLLESSVNMKFKPGPLSKKEHLDESYQRHNVGPTQATDLPSIGVLVSPKYGTIIEPFVLGFLKNFNDSDNVITEKWADFALSALGSVVNEEVVQELQSDLIFPLSYKNNQNKLLMRSCNLPLISGIRNTASKDIMLDNLDSEVIKILDDILNAVDIHLSENDFIADEEVSDPQDTIFNKNSCNTKDKGRMKYAELHRLDVTLLKCHDGENEPNKQCSNSFCTLGCVCSSLNSTYILRGHCGKVECMFGCNCYGSDSNSDLKENVSGLMCLENSLNSTLAKEEKKFHQTIVLGGSTGVTLRPKRHCKTTEKFEDFVFDSAKKVKVDKYHDVHRKALKVSLTRLALTNVEPWCIIHNVYKCFCNGKFTSTYITDDTLIEDSATDSRRKPPDNEIHFVTPSFKYTEKEHIQQTKINLDCTESLPTTNETKEPDTDNHKSQYSSNVSKSKERLQATKSSITYSSEPVKPDYQVSYDEMKNNCARTTPYKGRQYSQKYYFEKNMKIYNMEIHDSKLNSKLRNIIQRVVLGESMEHAENNKEVNIKPDEPSMQDNALPCFNEVDENTTLKTNQPTVLEKGTKLAAWLEKNYKCIQKKLQLNSEYINLGPPMERQVTLHPWEGIVQRYLLKKNVFLVTKTQPNRLFIAVNPKLEYFKNCINIETIKLEDLSQYPSTIQQIVTNICEKQNSFFILYGRKVCWEIVGSVTKLKASTVEDDKATTADETDTQLLRQTEIESDTNQSESENPTTLMYGDVVLDELNDLQKCQDAQTGKLAQKLRWYEQPIGDVVTEIQFYKKGFFVRYSRIEEAIHSAQSSGETVFLSAAVCKCGKEPQFGVYVSPISTSSVFIGPYEEHEQLGYKIITNINFEESTPPRGHWFETENTESIAFLKDPDICFEKNKSKRNDSIEEEKNNYKTQHSMPEPLLMPKIVKVESKSAGSHLFGSIANDESNRAMQNLVVTAQKAHQSSSFITPEINVNTYHNDKKLEVPVPANKKISSSKKKNIATKSRIDRITDTTLAGSTFQNTSNQGQENLVITAPNVGIHNQNIFKSVQSASLIKCRPLLSPANSSLSISEIIDSTYHNYKTLEVIVPDNKMISSSMKNSFATTSRIERITDTKLASPTFQNVSNQIQESYVIPASSVGIRDQSASLMKCKPLLSPVKTSSSVTSELSPIKIIKPIRIKKTNGFYHLQGKPLVKAIFKPVFCNMLPTNLKQNSMKILKPFEINDKLDLTKSSTSNKQDLEVFLASTAALTDKGELIKKNLNVGLWIDVWIESTNVKNLGYLKGRLRESTSSFYGNPKVKSLSFQFPGFSMTKFYKLEDAYNKINQALSRKVLVPENLNVEWRIVCFEKNLQSKCEMHESDFGPDTVLTPSGLTSMKLLHSLQELKTPTTTAEAISSPTTAEAISSHPDNSSVSQEKDVMQELREVCREISTDDVSLEDANDLPQLVDPTESTKTDTAKDGCSSPAQAVDPTESTKTDTTKDGYSSPAQDGNDNSPGPSERCRYTVEIVDDE